MKKETDVCVIELGGKIEGKTYEEMSEAERTAVRASVLSSDGINTVLECQVDGCATEMTIRELGKIIILETDTSESYLFCPAAERP